MSVAGAGFTGKVTAGIYNFHPWASWPLRGGNERLCFHQGDVFSFEFVAISSFSCDSPSSLCGWWLCCRVEVRLMQLLSVPLLNQIWILLWFWLWMKIVFCTRNYFVSKLKRDVAKVQDVHAVTQIVLHTSLAVFWVQKTIPCKTSILYSPQDLLVESLLWHLLSKLDLEQDKVLDGWQWRNVNSCCLSTSWLQVVVNQFSSYLAVPLQIYMVIKI